MSAGGYTLAKGGADADTFVYLSIEESTVERAGRDTILDFKHLADRIDLSKIDAVEASQSDDAFAFLGSATFDGTAGQLRAELIGGTTILSGDVDGDAIADFAIGLKGAAALTTADLIL
jgi:serralysin